VVYNHNTYISRSRTIVNQIISVRRASAIPLIFTAATPAHVVRSRACSRFNHGRFARATSFRRGAGIGGSHGRAGFRGGGRSKSREVINSMIRAKGFTRNASDMDRKE